MKPRPTESEFNELKRQRDASVEASIVKACKELGIEREAAQVHVSHADDCYCACPDGPCQHIWDGAEYVSEDQCMFSTTCSRCGAVCAYHDMRCMP